MDRNALCSCGSNKKYKKCCLLTAQKGVEPIKQNPFFISQILPELGEECDYASDRLAAGDLEGAQEVVNRLSLEYPDNYNVLFLQGVCAIQRGFFSEAISYFMKSVQIFPYFSESYYNLAGLYQKNCEIRKSVTCFKKVIEIEGYKSELGRKATQGIRDLEKIMSSQRGWSLEEYFLQEELFSQAFDYLQSKEFEQAIEFFKKVLERDPDHVQSYGNLGLAYASLGQKKDALECLNKALSLDQTYEPARYNLQIIQLLKEGERLNSHIQTVHYYIDRLKNEQREDRTKGQDKITYQFD